MPSARSAQTAAATDPRRAQTSPRPTRTRPASKPAPAPNGVRRVPLRASAVRVRWERVGRIALLVVLFAVAILYGTHAMSYLSTREQASHARATYVQAARQHRALEQQVHALRQPSTIVQRARQLGMTRNGEQPYVVPGAAGR